MEKGGRCLKRVTSKNRCNSLHVSETGENIPVIYYSNSDEPFSVPISSPRSACLVMTALVWILAVTVAVAVTVIHPKRMQQKEMKLMGQSYHCHYSHLKKAGRYLWKNNLSNQHMW